MDSRNCELDSKLENLRDDVVGALTSRVDMVEVKADGAMAAAVEAKQATDDNRDEINRLRGELASYKEKSKVWGDRLGDQMIQEREQNRRAHLSHEVARVENKLRLRERNLVLYGVEEGGDDVADIVHLRLFLKMILKLPHSRVGTMSFPMIFRRGASVDGRPRPLVVTMACDDDLWRVIKAANRQEVGDKVKRDLPPIVEKCRKSLNRLKYVLEKGGAKGLKIKFPAALWFGEQLVHDYFPCYKRGIYEFIDAQSSNNDFEEMPDELVMARQAGREAIRKEKHENKKPTPADCRESRERHRSSRGSAHASGGGSGSRAPAKGIADCLMRLSTTSFAQGEEGSSDGRGHSDTELSSNAEGDYKFEQDQAPPPAPNTPKNPSPPVTNTDKAGERADPTGDASIDITITESMDSVEEESNTTLVETPRLATPAVTDSATPGGMVPEPATAGPSTSNSGSDITSISSSKEEVIRQQHPRKSKPTSRGDLNEKEIGRRISDGNQMELSRLQSHPRGGEHRQLQYKGHKEPVPTGVKSRSLAATARQGAYNRRRPRLEDLYSSGIEDLTQKDPTPDGEEAVNNTATAAADDRATTQAGVNQQRI